MLTISVFAFSLKEFSAVAEQLGKIQIDIDYLKHRKEPPVQSDVRVVDPGDPNECITVTVHADPGTPEEEAESLKAKIEAVYAEFGRCP
jgi:hypothetical protein